MTPTTPKYGDVHSHVIRAAVAIALVLGLASDARAAKRWAFVVGIDDYDALPKLETAVADATKVARSFELAGFRVAAVVNPTAKELEEKWQAFLQPLAPGDFAVVYFAGHGLQKTGANYLLALDFARTDDPSVSAARLDRWIADLGGRKLAQRVIVLDACRNNPLGGTTAGLAAIENPAFGPDTYIIYATAPGRVARDGLFATHFAREVAQPGRRIDDVFNRTATDVRRESGGAQAPFAINSGGLSVLYFTNPDRVEPLRLARTDRCREALPKLQDYVKADPDDGPVLAALGHCQIIESQPAAARRTLERARRFVQLSPHVIETELALAAFEDGDVFDAKLRLLDARRTAPPEYVPARLLEGRILLKEGEYSRAIEVFDGLFQGITPASPESRADLLRACTLLADAFGLNGAVDMERAQRGRCSAIASAR